MADLISGRHTRPDISAAANAELEHINQVAACLRKYQVTSRMRLMVVAR